MTWEIDWEGPIRPKRQKNSACGRHLYYCKLRERLTVPFQSQNGQKFPACGRQLYYCKLRDRLRGPFQAKNAKKSCLRQALILLWTESEADSALSKSKISCHWQAFLLLWTERWAEGALSKPNRKKILPEAGTYIIVNWEIGWGGPFKGKKAKNLLPATGTYIIVNWERLTEPFQRPKWSKKICLRQAVKLFRTESDVSLHVSHCSHSTME